MPVVSPCRSNALLSRTFAHARYFASRISLYLTRQVLQWGESYPALAATSDDWKRGSIFMIWESQEPQEPQEPQAITFMYLCDVMSEVAFEEC